MRVPVRLWKSLKTYGYGNARRRCRMAAPAGILFLPCRKGCLCFIQDGFCIGKDIKAAAEQFDAVRKAE